MKSGDCRLLISPRSWWRSPIVLRSWEVSSRRVKIFLLRRGMPPKRNSLGLPTVCSSNTKNSSADWRCNHGWADADLADLAAKFPSLPPRPGPQSPAFFASPRGGVGPTYLHKRCHNIILAGQLGGPRGRGSWRWWLLIAWTTSLPLQR